MMQLAARGAQHTVTLFNALFADALHFFFFFSLAARCVANFLISHFEFGDFDSKCYVLIVCSFMPTSRHPLHVPYQGNLKGTETFIGLFSSFMLKNQNGSQFSVTNVRLAERALKHL